MNEMKKPAYSQFRYRKGSQYLRKFKAVAEAIYFVCVIKNRRKRFIAERKEKCYEFGKRYVQQACHSMQTYYYHLLQQQITQYILLLEKVSKHRNYDAAEDILRILSFATSKLNSSVIPKSLISSLGVVGIDYSFFNFPFLFEAVISRL